MSAKVSSSDIVSQGVRSAVVKRLGLNDEKFRKVDFICRTTTMSDATVLVVDDEKDVADVFALQLDSQYENHITAVPLLRTDGKMPHHDEGFICYSCKARIPT